MTQKNRWDNTNDDLAYLRFFNADGVQLTPEETIALLDKDPVAQEEVRALFAAKAAKGEEK